MTCDSCYNLLQLWSSCTEKTLAVCNCRTRHLTEYWLQKAKQLPMRETSRSSNGKQSHPWGYLQLAYHCWHILSSRLQVLLKIGRRSNSVDSFPLLLFFSHCKVQKLPQQSVLPQPPFCLHLPPCENTWEDSCQVLQWFLIDPWHDDLNNILWCVVLQYFQILQCVQLWH